MAINVFARERITDADHQAAVDRAWQLRHPVGPDAIPFLRWRASMTDEQWVDWNALNDEDWYQAVQNTFGLNARR